MSDLFHMVKPAQWLMVQREIGDASLILFASEVGFITPEAKANRITADLKSVAAALIASGEGVRTVELVERRDGVPYLIQTWIRGKDHAANGTGRNADSHS